MRKRNIEYLKRAQHLEEKNTIWKPKITVNTPWFDSLPNILLIQKLYQMYIFDESSFGKSFYNVHLKIASILGKSSRLQNVSVGTTQSFHVSDYGLDICVIHKGGPFLTFIQEKQNKKLRFDGVHLTFILFPLFLIQSSSSMWVS